MVTIVKGGVTFSLPSVADASLEDIAAIMAQDSVIVAVAASLAAGFNLAENYLKILKVSTVDSKQSRRLQSGYSVSVEYYAQVPDTGSHSATAIAKDMIGLTSTTSSANERFVHSFATKMKSVAEHNNGNRLLTNLAVQVELNGITVESVMEPVIIELVVPLRATTTMPIAGESLSEDDDESHVKNLVVNGMAAIFGVLSACLSGLLGWYLLTWQLMKLAPDEDANAVAPEMFQQAPRIRLQIAAMRPAELGQVSMVEELSPPPAPRLRETQLSPPPSPPRAAWSQASNLPELSARVRSARLPPIEGGLPSMPPVEGGLPPMAGARSVWPPMAGARSVWADAPHRFPEISSDLLLQASDQDDEEDVSRQMTLESALTLPGQLSRRDSREAEVERTFSEEDTVAVERTFSEDTLS
jgi:hypothetical protein